MNRLVMAFVATALAATTVACDRAGKEAVSFRNDVMPILRENCLDCHDAVGQGTAASGFSVVSYNGLMQGTQYGPVVVPGDPDASVLMQLVEGRADPSIAMPHGDSRKLYAAEKDVLRAWIAQGAPDN
ncbi:MAG: hypothetical protein P8080_07240 [Gammaproteobacteria bacterium]